MPRLSSAGTSRPASSCEAALQPPGGASAREREGAPAGGTGQEPGCWPRPPRLGRPLAGRRPALSLSAVQLRGESLPGLAAPHGASGQALPWGLHAPAADPSAGRVAAAVVHPWDGTLCAGGLRPVCPTHVYTQASPGLAGARQSRRGPRGLRRPRGARHPEARAPEALSCPTRAGPAGCGAPCARHSP